MASPTLGELFRQVAQNLGYQSEQQSGLTLGQMLQPPGPTPLPPPMAQMEAPAIMNPPPAPTETISNAGPQLPPTGWIFSPIEEEKAAFAAEAAPRASDRPDIDTGGLPPWLRGAADLGLDLASMVRRGHRVANAPIPGANPEVPTGMAGMEGVMLTEVAPQLLGRTAGGGMESLRAPGSRPRPRESAIVSEPVTAPPFYSRLRRVVEDPKTQAKQTGSQWLSFLKGPKRGVKEAEMKWTGLDSFLKERSGERVTRDQILEHLASNEIQVVDVTKGIERELGEPRIVEVADDLIEMKPDIPGADKPGSTGHELLIQRQRNGDWAFTAESQRRLVERDGVKARSAGQWFPTPEAAISWAQEEVYRPQIRMVNQPTKFGPGSEYGDKYILPGYENYREVLLQLPTQDLGTKQRTELYDKLVRQFGPNTGQWPADNPDVRRLQGMSSDFAENAAQSEFTAGHWDEPNVLAHLRLSDRTTDGKKTLLVEEIQSDWGQKKRKGEDVPDAPFVESTSEWVRLGLKRVLKMAADEGYDRVAIVRGKEQADRYNLRKQIESLEWSEARSQLLARDKHGKVVLDRREVTRENLPDLIGKEATERLLNAEPSGKPIIEKQANGRYLARMPGDPTERGRFGDTPSQALEALKRAEDSYTVPRDPRIGIRRLTGQDLEVGGEGMKSFYDQIVPQELDKLGKEYGIKVQKEGATVDTRSEPKWEGIEYFETRRDAKEFIQSEVGDPERARIRSLGPREWVVEILAEGEEIPTGPKTPVHSIDIPPEAREKIKREGFPIISRYDGMNLGQMARNA